MKTKGTKNIVSFEKRTIIDTSSSQQVLHLARIRGSPVEEFSALLKHQRNYLKWISKRHELITESAKKSKAKKGPQGAKKATFVKYRWYSEQLVLLEAINAFETFYKTTFTRLGIILQPYIQPDEERVIRINARQLWAIAGETVLPTLVPVLVFEQELFHDLDEVDRASDMLIGQRRYKRKEKNNQLKNRIRALRGIFQVRHTLSHNNGLVTTGDEAKFREIGYTIAVQEIIDPSKNHLSHAIFKELEVEAMDFTKWLAFATATFLEQCIKDRGLAVPRAKRKELESLLGKHRCWTKVTWS